MTSFMNNANLKRYFKRTKRDMLTAKRTVFNDNLTDLEKCFYNLDFVKSVVH